MPTETLEVDSAAQEALESKVEAGLASVFTDQDSESESATEEVVAPTNEGQEQPAEAAAKEVVPEQVATEEVVPAATESAPTLPAAYIRSLKALEWTDEEIQAASVNSKFIETAAKLHASRNKQVAEWAEAGRRTRQTITNQPATPASGKSATESVLAGLDAEALKKEFGEDRLIDALASRINPIVEQVKALLPLVQQSQERTQKSELEMLGKQINTFFGSDEIKPYREIYGTPGQTLTPDQSEAQTKVLEMADALIAGAKLQNRDLTVGDALQMAFDSISSSHKVQAVRTELTQALKTRERSITLKPTASGARGSGKIDSRAALERKVSAGLASVFSS